MQSIPWSEKGGKKDPSNITSSFSVTSHELFPCDAKLQRDDSRLKDTRCIGTVPLASRRVSFQARWRSQCRASKKEESGWRGGEEVWREEGETRRNGPKDRSVMKSAGTAMTEYDEMEARERSPLAISSNEPGVAWHVLCRARLLTSATVGDVSPWTPSSSSSRSLSSSSSLSSDRAVDGPPAKPTTGDNYLPVWGCAWRPNLWPSRRKPTRKVVPTRKKIDWICEPPSVSLFLEQKPRPLRYRCTLCYKAIYIFTIFIIMFYSIRLYFMPAMSIYNILLLYIETCTVV